MSRREAQTAAVGRVTVVVPALWPFSVALTEVGPAGMEIEAVLKNANVSLTARLTVIAHAFGLLR